jgi:hypothetical protein
MTKILLAAMTLAAVLLAFTSSAQGFAMPMQDKTQDIIHGYALTRDVTMDKHLILTSDAPTTKGGKPAFHLIPKPQEGVDGIAPVQTSTPDLILTSVKTVGGATTLKLVPKTQEGIDGVVIPKTVTPQEDVTQTKVFAEPEKVLVSVTTSTGSTTLKMVPKPQEGIDGIPLPKAADIPMMLVAEPPTSKGSPPVYHLVPRPAPDSRDSSS